MLVLGVDPGLAHCGLALLEADDAGARVLDLQVCQTKAGETLQARLTTYQRRMSDVMRNNAPDVVVIERPSFPRSAKAAAMLWSAWGIVAGLADSRALLVQPSAGEWRKALGLPACARGDEGKAERKASTAAMMRARFPGVDTLMASVIPSKREHALDALAIACSWVDTARGAKEAA